MRNIVMSYDTPPSLSGLKMRHRLGRAEWSVPERYGPDGWSFVHRSEQGSVIISVAEQDDGHDWIHASMAWTDRLPTYDELVLLHRAVFGEGWAYQIFAPSTEHVNIHGFALHLWGRRDGSAGLPDFTHGVGSI